MGLLKKMKCIVTRDPFPGVLKENPGEETPGYNANLPFQNSHVAFDFIYEVFNGLVKLPKRL